jgi:Transposase, Mutator family
MRAGCCQSDGVGSLKSCQTMKEADAVRRTVPPSAEIQANIDKLLASGLVDDPQRMLSKLARLGARLIIQRAVEQEFDAWLGRARYERRPDGPPGKRHGFRPRHVQTPEGELRIEIPQVREAAAPFVSKRFREGYTKRLLRSDRLRATIVGAFVRGPSMRDVESLCKEAGLGKTSKSTVARICAELHERFEAFKRRDLYDIKLVVLFLDAIARHEPLPDRAGCQTSERSADPPRRRTSGAPAGAGTATAPPGNGIAMLTDAVRVPMFVTASAPRSRPGTGRRTAASSAAGPCGEAAETRTHAPAPQIR